MSILVTGHERSTNFVRGKIIASAEPTFTLHFVYLNFVILGFILYIYKIELVNQHAELKLVLHTEDFSSENIMFKHFTKYI